MLLRAFAKINLDLRIAGRREDGYHEVCTVLQTIDWFDEIRIQPADRFQFTATEGPGDETNLVVRAVRGVERLLRAEANLHIHLVKNVPSGAGLGGGSADAAVTVMGLERWFGARLADNERFQLLRSLGADVPFFNVGGRAAGVGRGDEIMPLEDLTDYCLLLVVPAVSISSAEAYSWLTVQEGPLNMEGFRAQFLSGPQAEQGANDFETPVFARHGELADIKRALLGLGAYRASLSGSGSTVFGQFHDQAGARQAASMLSRSFRVRLASPLPRSEYFQRMFAEL